MTGCKHRFQKFDDTSLFCERCGERKVIAAKGWVPDWTYRPYPVYPWYGPWPWPHYYYTVWCDTGTSTITTQSDSTFILNGGVTNSAPVSTNAIGGPQTYTPRGVR